LFAEAARQMTQTEIGLPLLFNGVTRFDKPPLIYWLMASAYETLASMSLRLDTIAPAGLGTDKFALYTLRYFGGVGILKPESTRCTAMAIMASGGIV
jgi:4-amino-4-deoxy-L-arabinose transferase-like glycosyltransferase